MGEERYGRVIGRYYWESEPAWPEPVRPPEGAPNVLIFLLDDVGFAQLGCFGSDIETPNLDRLAAGGLRFTNFHTTALCSPTRACVLTGRNHHNVGMGRLSELAAGFPGYHARIPETCGFLPAMLTEHGYSAWAVGKWHLTPDDEAHHAGSRKRWPLGRGFERFYGFFEGETHQNAPALVCDNHQVAPPRSIEEGYHLTEDLVDHAIGLVGDLRSIDPGKPFLLYLATGACHSPHQAPPEWIDRYRGRFDEGWDVWRERTLQRQIESGVLPPGTELSPRPEWVPAWDELDADQRRLYARFMEAFAGFLSHTDHQLGRLLDFLAETGDLDNTLILALSDNGASSEGGPDGSINDVRPWNMVGTKREEALARIDEIGGPRLHNNYPWGWTVAGNTPFRRWKREVHEGGVADPLVVHWPGAVPDPGGLRRQYTHAIDIVPTVLEAVGIEPPAVLGGIPQQPLDGTSFVYAIRDATAPERHTTQYYEMFGCRAIYHDGWKAVTYHPIQAAEPGLDQVAWELYHVAEDVSECHDLAAEMPEKLAAMVELWWAEAGRNKVLPIDNRPMSDMVVGRPSPLPHLTRAVYRPGSSRVPERAAIDVKNRDHRILATVEVPDGGAEGVLIAQGSFLGGWSLYVLDGCLRYAHNLAGRPVEHVTGDVPLTPGRHELEMRLERRPDRGADVSLLVDGAVVGQGFVKHLPFTRYSLTGAGLTCGYGLAPAVTDDYVAPFPFTGRLEPVVIETGPGPGTDPRADAEAAIASQ